MIYFQLICKIILGCYREFGIREILTRTMREILGCICKPDVSLDISFVTENLGIGAAPRSKDAVRELKGLGITHLIDLRAERKESNILTESNEMIVHWVPTYDDWQPKPLDFYTKLGDEIKKSMLVKGDAKLFICCGAGKHRAPLAGVFALGTMGYSLDDAVLMIKKARPNAELLPVYISSLRSYHAGRVERNH